MAERQYRGNSNSQPGGIRLGGTAQEKPFLPRPPAWTEQAACLGMDVNVFFPAARGSISAIAEQTCSGCPVRGECLTWALERNEEHGVFGGETPRDRHARADRLRAAGAAA